MSGLTRCERDFMEIFGNVGRTEGHVVLTENVLAARTQCRSQDCDQVLNAIIESLVKKGLLTIEPDQSSLRLTAEGELYLYGEDDEIGSSTDCEVGGFTDCEREFMRVFAHFRCIAGHLLGPHKFLAVRHQLMSPLCESRTDEIVLCLEQKGLLEQVDAQETLRLTDAGQEFLYGRKR